MLVESEGNVSGSQARSFFAFRHRPTEIHLVHHTHVHGLTKDDGLLGGGTVRVDKSMAALIGA